MALPQLDIDRMSPDERIELAERLWNSLRAVPEQIRLTVAQEEELDRRLEAYRGDRDPGEPWREALSGVGKSTP